MDKSKSGVVGQLKFGANDTFLKELRKRVDQMFESSNRRRRDCLAMYFKTTVILGWSLASYLLLICWASTWWQASILAVSLGISLACIGFTIQHDGSHGAYSNRKWVNRLMALSLDMIGASSYMWQRSHNTVHHTFTNITDHDGDIDLGILGRLSPHQRRLSFHSWQHIYLWFFYGLIAFKWQIFDDIRAVIDGKVGRFKISRPRGWDLAFLIGGKLLFFTIAFVIPMLIHPWYVVLLFYFLATFVQGLLLSIVFQLAHCVEEAEFPLPLDDERMESAWAVHQVETTVNFANRNPFVTWFFGSLNFQIEHHLFPKICHVNYPAIAKIVSQTCKEFGINYSSHDTCWSALSSHYRWLRQMGRPAEAQ